VKGSKSPFFVNVGFIRPHKPLFIRVPGLTKGGQRVDEPVSLIDIYPTLKDLCGLEGPTFTEGGHPLSGHSLRGLLEDPEGGKWAGDDVAITAISRNWIAPKEMLKMSVEKLRENQEFSIRSKQYRYVYISDDESYLYDLANDPIESRNLSGDAKYKKVLQEFRKKVDEL